MAQLEHIEAIEKRLWSAADTLRANSNYASNEYFLPVMGLVFLRHAYSRFLGVKDAIEAGLPTRGGKTRPLTKEDFSQKSAIFLQPKAQFDTLVALPDSADRAKAIIDAMESIEDDYENLRGVLPKSEYQELDNAVLGQLLRTLNPEELKRVSGDVFGRIYEYFLTQFADQKAHDGGEFFTPVSLVSLIANVIEPAGGTVLDPACGSGGMFVQSARVVERRHENPTEKLTFYGLEKNATTIRLAKMNLAVHGLEGDIQKSITYYEDPHELLRKADFVMANPPFNVDEIDADKVKSDPRLPFGLPGVNKKGKVSNGNYVWISYFYSYLNEQGRAGFVMSSQASSAGRDEAKVRQKLVETGDVDSFRKSVSEQQSAWGTQKTSNGELTTKQEAKGDAQSAPEGCAPRTAHINKAVDRLATLAEASRDLVKQTDLLYKLACRLIETCENECDARDSDAWAGRDITRARKAADEARALAVEQLKQVRYFWRQAHWLTERFPEAELRDVEGLVKLVDRAEIDANDWSLTPGRYVGVAPEEEDEDFDFEEALRDIHVELEDLNAEAVQLAATIKRNFEELGV
jgi:type I restriction-modification system DNA methylase subunit